MNPAEQFIDALVADSTRQPARKSPWPGCGCSISDVGVPTDRTHRGGHRWSNSRCADGAYSWAGPNRRGSRHDAPGDVLDHAWASARIWRNGQIRLNCSEGAAPAGCAPRANRQLSVNSFIESIYLRGLVAVLFPPSRRSWRPPRRNPWVRRVGGNRWADLLWVGG